MFRFLMFKWRRLRLEASIRSTERQCRKRVRAAKKAKESHDEVERKQLYNSFDWLEAQDELKRLDSRYLLEQAKQLDVAIPATSNTNVWEESGITGKRYLTREGRRSVRAAIRAEQKERHETLRIWAPVIASAIAALAAWAAALKK